MMNSLFTLPLQNLSHVRSINGQKKTLHGIRTPFFKFPFKVVGRSSN